MPGNAWRGARTKSGGGTDGSEGVETYGRGDGGGLGCPRPAPNFRWWWRAVRAMGTLVELARGNGNGWSRSWMLRISERVGGSFRRGDTGLASGTLDGDGGGGG